MYSQYINVQFTIRYVLTVDCNAESHKVGYIVFELSKVINDWDKNKYI